MRVLVACEFSGVVRDAFRRRGHDAVSCDLLPGDGPGPHVQANVLDLLDDGFDLMIAHPPCTYLCSSGLHWNKRGAMVDGRPRAELTDEALQFVEALMRAPIPRIAIENPIGCISTRLDATEHGFISQKAAQVVQPHQFGHDASKQTALWLKGLPLLRHTDHVPPRWICCGDELDMDHDQDCPVCGGERNPLPRWANQTNSGQNRLPPSDDRWKKRSVTYAGIADAMASQWGIIDDEGE